MNPSSHSESPAPSNKRRAIVLGLAAGICATVVGARRFGSSGIPAIMPGAEKPSKTAAKPSPETPAAPEPAVEALIPEQLSHAWFLPHEKSRFSVVLASSDVNMTLVEISQESRFTADAVAYSAFSLIFDAPRGTVSQDGVYRLRHAALGEMDLFLAPVEHHADRVRYEAAFTRKA